MDYVSASHLDVALRVIKLQWNASMIRRKRVRKRAPGRVKPKDSPPSIAYTITPGWRRCAREAFDAKVKAEAKKGMRYDRTVLAKRIGVSNTTITNALGLGHEEARDPDWRLGDKLQHESLLDIEDELGMTMLRKLGLIVDNWYLLTDKERDIVHQQMQLVLAARSAK